MEYKCFNRVDNIESCLTLGTLNYGKFGIFLIMGIYIINSRASCGHGLVRVFSYGSELLDTSFLGILGCTVVAVNIS